MAFRKKTVEFLQKERDELPSHRPVIIFLVCPSSPEDLQQRTQAYSQFQPTQGLPEGVRVREGNPYTCCIVEAGDGLVEQLRATLESFRDAAHKVLVVNGRGSPEGVLLEGEERLTGSSLAQLAWNNCHDRHFHLVLGVSHGEQLSEAFFSEIKGQEKAERRLFATTFFRSLDETAVPATTGGVHSEIKQDMTGFLARHVRPNSPYKSLDAKKGKSPSCLIM